jgi:hypothetical protein
MIMFIPQEWIQKTTFESDLKDCFCWLKIKNLDNGLLLIPSEDDSLAMNLNEHDHFNLILRLSRQTF